MASPDTAPDFDSKLPRKFAEGLVKAWLRPSNGPCTSSEVNELIDYIGYVLMGSFGSEPGREVLQDLTAYWLLAEEKKAGLVIGTDVKLSLDTFLHYGDQNASTKSVYAGFHRICDACGEKSTDRGDVRALVYVVDYLEYRENRRKSKYEVKVKSIAKALLSRMLAMPFTSDNLSEPALSSAPDTLSGHAWKRPSSVCQKIDDAEEKLFQYWYSRKREGTTGRSGNCTTEKETTEGSPVNSTSIDPMLPKDTVSQRPSAANDEVIMRRVADDLTWRAKVEDLRRMSFFQGYSKFSQNDRADGGSHENDTRCAPTKASTF